MTRAARTELPAAERFSARINSDEEMAGLPDMVALSLVRVECAKQIREHLRQCTIRRWRIAHFRVFGGADLVERRNHRADLAGERRRLFVLGFDARHFQLSEGPILEEMTYA